MLMNNANAVEPMPAGLPGILKQSAVFRDLEQPILNRLAMTARLIEAGCGDRIFHAGERCAEVFFIADGLVRCEMNSPSGNGKQLVLDCVESGNLLGVEPLLNGNGYTHDAVADSDTTLVAIPVMRFLHLLREEPAFTAHVLASVSGRVCRLLADRASLTTQTAQQRIASHLLRRYDDEQAAAPIPGLPSRRADLASLLAITPETLCRALTKMRESGLLQRTTSGLSVTDPDGLAVVAGTDRTAPVNA